MADTEINWGTELFVSNEKRNNNYRGSSGTTQPRLLYALSNLFCSWVSFHGNHDTYVTGVTKRKRGVFPDR